MVECHVVRLQRLDEGVRGGVLAVLHYHQLRDRVVNAETALQHNVSTAVREDAQHGEDVLRVGAQAVVWWSTTC